MTPLLPGLERRPLPRGADLRATLAAPRSEVVKHLVVRLAHGKKQRPDSALVSRERGLEGDRWSLFRPSKQRQITLMDERVVAMLLARDGAEDFERPGDNLVIDHATSVSALPAGLRLRIGGALLELNDVPHMGCKKFEARFGSDALAWVNDDAHHDLRLRGVHAVVVEDGLVSVGDRLEVVGRVGETQA